MSEDSHSEQTADDSYHLEQSLEKVREALTGLQFGAVTLTVHGGRVVQIDITEKKRL